MTNIKVIKGDITLQSSDAIVNAANTSLLGGSGVDGAIHRAGGIVILEECLNIRAKQGGCPVGEAVITTAGNLPARFVIHTVGPVWQAGKEEKLSALLSNCYKNSLLLAVQHGLKTIAFPNISTGIYHYPKAKAASVAVETVQHFLQENEAIEEVVFVCFDEENHQIYQSLLS